MTPREAFNIPKRKGKILSPIKAKIRHDHAILIKAGKPKMLVAKVLSSGWQISLASYYRIIK